jgi:hypothetical protein
MQAYSIVHPPYPNTSVWISVSSPNPFCSTFKKPQDQYSVLSVGLRLAICTFMGNNSVVAETTINDAQLQVELFETSEAQLKRLQYA